MTRRWADGLLTFGVASGAALAALLVWAAVDPLVDATLRAVSVGRLLGATAAYVAVFGAVYGAITWLEGGRPTSILGSAAQILAAPLLFVLLPLEALLGVPTDGVLRPASFLLVVAGGAALAVLPLRWLRARIEGPQSDDEWPIVEPDPALGAAYWVLIVDGDCAFCRASVRWLLARDVPGRLRVASRDSAFARGVLARHPALATVDSVLWVEADPLLGEFVLTRWRAASKAAQHVGGWPGLLAQELDRLLPLRILDAGYRVVATLRRQLPAEPSCRLSDAVSAERLLA